MGKGGVYINKLQHIKIMVNKKIKDIIFLDTSIFEANNFLEGQRIKEIFKLSEKEDIKIVLPRLTYEEIINRVKKNIEEAISKFKKCRNETRILRNIPSLKNKFDQIDIDNAKVEHIQEIERIFRKAKIIIIDYQPIDIKDIFNSYFNHTFPFSTGKKYEFPDAFALKIIEEWSEKENVTVKVFAKDKDIINYNGKYLQVHKDFNKYLDKKLEEIAKNYELYQKIETAISEYAEKIIGDIRNWIYSELDDLTKYYDFTNDLEIHDINITEINIDLEEHQITSIDKEYITVEFKTYINYKVDLIIDDEDYMIKDYDTKEWIFLKTKNETVDEIKYINVDVIFYIDENEIIDYEIEEINNGYELKI